MLVTVKKRTSRKDDKNVVISKNLHKKRKVLRYNIFNKSFCRYPALSSSFFRPSALSRAEVVAEQ